MEVRYAEFLERWRSLCFGVDPADESVPSVGFTQDVNALRDNERSGGVKVTMHVGGRELGTWEDIDKATLRRRPDASEVDVSITSRPLLIDERVPVPPPGVSAREVMAGFKRAFGKLGRRG